jgi:MFS family permease
VWAVAQIGAGAWSDRVGRKRLIVAGMFLQAGAIGAIAAGSSFTTWLVAGVVLGLGTGLVYPTLLAVVADVADPAWRGSAIGVYRLWRDLGFAAGAIVVGLVADAAGIASAIWIVAIITGASGLVVLVRMRETRPGPLTGRPGGR